MDAFRRVPDVFWTAAGAPRGGCASAGGSGDVIEMMRPAPSASVHQPMHV